MGQKLLGHNRPAEAACRHAMIDMGPDKSVLILIKHCRAMKQQETCLRLITLLLLLSCTALFLFFVGADFRQQEKSGSSGQGSAVEQSPAYSKQECLADNPQTNLERLYIHLRSVAASNDSDKIYLEWDVAFGEKYNREKRAIVIPKGGFYFAYVRIDLSCHDVDAAEVHTFCVELHKWNKGYSKIVRLAEASESILCSSEGFRNVFIGQLFELTEGDHVMVWIEKGYKLIRKSSFGAYLT